MTESTQSLPGHLQDRPILLGIAGFSGSGKTTLARLLARAPGVVHFPLDNYYRDLSHLPPEERARQNFDDPAMIESSLLAAHVAALSRGETIERPLYDFATHTRVPSRTETIPPAPLVIVEGLFALAYPALLPLYQLRVYLDTSEALSFERRLHRDVAERGRTPESVRRQYEETVRPAALAWVRPSSANADLIVSGAEPPERMADLIAGELRRRNLFPFPD